MGIVDSVQELRVELTDDAMAEEVRDRLAKVGAVVWLRDRHGSEFAVRTEFVSWVEIEPSA
ncbi:MAG TPA: DUF3107 family protein [Ilumatobacter sp.]|nr:DUF3107 family protein [Ilumatobacter sp.]